MIYLKVLSDTNRVEYRPPNIQRPSWPYQNIKMAENITNAADDADAIQTALVPEVRHAIPVAAMHLEDSPDLPTMTKLELAARLFEQIGLSKREAKEIVEAFFDEIGNALARGDAVRLFGLGNFQLRDKSRRPGRNPKTGEKFIVEARRVVTFRPGGKLKELVEEGNPCDQAD